MTCVDSTKFIFSSIGLGLLIIIIATGIFSHKILHERKPLSRKSKRKSSFIFSDENEPKLILLTKFNTLVNKLMPEKVNEYVQRTYEKIYGKDSVKLYINEGKSNIKRTKKKKISVSFNDYVEEREFTI
jgi:uncharacterized protein YbcC (UPF0753/DUF2309 family)